MNNYRLLEVSFIGATNFKPARVKISCYRRKQTVIMSMDYESRSICDQAEKLLKKAGINLIGICEVSDKSFGLLTDNFEFNLKELKG